MDEKSAFDILYENLIELGLKPETHRSHQSFIIPGSDRFLNTKYVIANFDSIFFVASDSYGTKAYTSSTYTGIYSLIELQPDFECKIYKKDWIDSFLRFKKRKIGVKYIDENITITSSSLIPSDLLSTENVDLFLKINQTKPFQLLIQNDYLSFISQLKGKKVIGLEISDWIYEKSDLEKMINMGSKLLQDIKKTKRGNENVEPPTYGLFRAG